MIKLHTPRWSIGLKQSLLNPNSQEKLVPKQEAQDSTDGIQLKHKLYHIQLVSGFILLATRSCFQSSQECQKMGRQKRNLSTKSINGEQNQYQEVQWPCTFRVLFDEIVGEASVTFTAHAQDDCIPTSLKDDVRWNPHKSSRRQHVSQPRRGARGTSSETVANGDGPAGLFHLKDPRFACRKLLLVAFVRLLIAVPLADHVHARDPRAPVPFF